MTTDGAIKAGRRHRASDEAIMKSMRADWMGMAAKMSDYFKALGFEDENDDGEVSMDEAESQGFEGKALDLESRCEMVCEAVHEALEEVGILDDEEDDDSLGEMAGPVRQIASDYKGKGEDEARVLCYDKYAVAMIGPISWQIPYSLDGGMVVLGDPDQWQRVEAEWKPVPGAQGIVGGAVKMLDDGTVVAQAIRYGNPDEADMSAYADYFTKSTDFWLGAWDRRPMLYHHALDEGTQDAPVIGEWTKAWTDDEGVWLQGQLDKAHKYHAAIKELARRGLLRISTDSAPHLVQRTRQANGTHEVKRWPVLAASLTPSPAEPRLLPAELKAQLADLGLLIDANAQADGDDLQRPDGAKADVDREQAAALLTLIQIQEMA